MRIDVFHHWSDDTAIRAMLQTIITRSDHIMATVEQLNQAVTDTATAVNSLADTIAAEGVQVATAIQALKDQIAAGTVTGIDPAALDPALANLTNIATAAAAAKTAIESIFTPDAPQV